MRALLLAAGMGTRLRPVTDHVPKCLVPINGVPLIDYWLEQLLNAGIERVLVNTHYLSEQVNQHIKSSIYSKYIDTVHENSLLNTGGSILVNKEYFHNDSFMVVHADNLSFCDFEAFIESHKRKEAGVEITMMTFKTDNPTSCGVVELNKSGLVTNFYEKVGEPPSDLANAAVYIMDISVVEFIEELHKKDVDISIDVLPKYLGKIGTFFNNNYHRDIGTVESYALSQIEINRRNK